MLEKQGDFTVPVFLFFFFFFIFIFLNICLKENLVLSGVRPISTRACGTY